MMTCMLRKEKKRRIKDSKATAFTFNGHRVDEKLDRFRKRRKLDDDEIGSSSVCKWPFTLDRNRPLMNQYSNPFAY